MRQISSFYNFIPFLIAVLLVACENNGLKKANPKKPNPTDITKSKDYDTLITTPCALLIYPSIHQLDSMQKKDGDDFYTVADDNQYYMDLYTRYLDSIKAKKIRKNARGTFAFKTVTGEIFKEKIDTLYWNIILFNGRTKPKLVDLTSIEDEYTPYMELKK